MGNTYSNMKNWLFAGPSARIAIAGIDNAGKTAILYRLKLGTLVETNHTIGFNLETVEYKNVTFVMCDVGGQKAARMLHYKHYLQDTEAFIFVVDSTDPERFEEVKEELEDLLQEDPLEEKKLLIFCNKCDNSDATSSTELVTHLELAELVDREWAVQSCSAKTGEGLFEGLETLYSSLFGKNPLQRNIA